LTEIKVSLPTGELTLTLAASDFCLDDLTAYAARQNPKRGFLFVSKLLAKYWPSQPLAMWKMHQYLAQQLASSVKDSAVFVGMAEAAAGLGQGVYEAYLQQSQVCQQHLFIHTSRYFLANQQYLDFQEHHSHASQFYCYVPEQATLKTIFLHAQTLVLIDDEMTTGKTFVNFIQAYQRLNPELTNIIIVCILSFVDNQRQQEIQQQCHIDIQFISGLSAGLQFEKNRDYCYKNVPNVKGNQDCKRHLLSVNAGRLGIQGQLMINYDPLKQLTKSWQQGQKILVLGTGEFIHLAFLVARKLEQQGWQVIVQSTARSPLSKGEAIREKMEFIDSYHDNIPNYLYNVSPNQYEQVLLCHETPVCQSLTQLAQQLNASLLYYANGKILIS